VKVHHTPIGDLIVLPPHHDYVAAGHLFAVGEVVDGDVECPTCEGKGTFDHPLVRGADVAALCDDCRSGTVTVPHVVRTVVPIVANFEGATMPNAVLLVTETGVEWWGRGDNEAHHLADLVLPDAEPGGVALLVERAS
jgi:hypothetical protein